MAPRKGRGRGDNRQQTLSLWMRRGDKPDASREAEAPTAAEDSEGENSPDEPPAKQRKVTSPGGAVPSLRERLAARGAEPPPEAGATAFDSPKSRDPQAKTRLRGKVPAPALNQQKLLFRASPGAAAAAEEPSSGSKRRTSSDTPVATPCRQAHDFYTPKSDSKSDLSESADPTLKEVTSKAQGDSPATLEALRRPSSNISAASETADPDVARQRRREEASHEIARILPLKQKRFCSEVMRAKAILGLTIDAHEISLVQQAFRSLMRKLHPDRIGECPKAAEAMELLQESKQQCERAFSQLRPPAQPTHLSFTVLCAAVGRRRLRLCWKAPDVNQSCPVRRYLVAALDPAYGQALTITVLEPDYSEDLKRFTTIEELTTYDLIEEELTKMPGFFQQATAVVRVAAENELGQSKWCSLQLPLQGITAVPVASPVPGGLGAPRPVSKKCVPAPGSNVSSRECRDFEAKAHELRESGNALCTWLRKQSKALLSGWLKSQGWPTTGSKDELVDRVAFAVGAVSKVR